MIQIHQFAENIPQEFMEQKRFIPVHMDKRPYKGWNQKSSWKRWDEIQSARGFVITGTDYLVLDGDHVLDDNGRYVNEKVKAFFDSLPATYMEKSCSGHGVHAFYKWTTDEINRLSAGKEATLYFEEQGNDKSAKIELWYRTGRQFVLTGNIWNDAPTTILQDEKKVQPLVRETLRQIKRQTSSKSNYQIAKASNKMITKARKNDDRKYAEKLLKRVSSDCQYDDWIKVGMVLKTVGCDVDIFDAWSAEAPSRYPGKEEIQKKWDSFQGSADGNNVGIGTLVRMAKMSEAFHVVADDGLLMETRVLEDEERPYDWPVTTIDGSKPLPTSVENVIYLLNRLRITCRYNLMSKDIEIGGLQIEGIKTDNAVTLIRGEAYKKNLKISRQDLMDNLNVIAEQNQYSPVRDYLEECYQVYQDDGQNPLDELFALLVLDKSKHQDGDFCKLLLRRWLISCVKAAFNDGDTAIQGILVLQGPQGIGKTRFLYKLLPSAEWGTDAALLDPSQKDDVMRVTRLWLVELGELGGTLKKDLNRLKGFLTQKSDDLRKPYARTVERTPRTTAFLGTINEDQFLKDLTGDRRFWVISLSAIKEKNINLMKLWGYVMHLARDEQEPHYLQAEELAKLYEQNRLYRVVSDEEQLLWDRFDWQADVSEWIKYSMSEVSFAIGLEGRKASYLGRIIKKSFIGVDSRVEAFGDSHHGIKYLLPPVRLRMN